MITRAEDSLESALTTIRAAADSLADVVEKMPSRPSSVEATFGVKFTAQASAIVSGASAEASFVVKIAWAAQTS